MLLFGTPTAKDIYKNDLGFDQNFTLKFIATNLASQTNEVNITLRVSRLKNFV
jgi:hypothetical protein